MINVIMIKKKKKIPELAGVRIQAGLCSCMIGFSLCQKIFSLRKRDKSASAAALVMLIIQRVGSEVGRKVAKFYLSDNYNQNLNF